MTRTGTAKVFTTGRSQAVRLPAAFRFDTHEVFIRRDETTGDVVLSARPDSWEGVVALNKADVPTNFLGEADRQQGTASRDPWTASMNSGLDAGHQCREGGTRRTTAACGHACWRGVSVGCNGRPVAYGLAKRVGKAGVHEAMRQLLLRMQIADWTESVAETCGQLRAALEGDGRKLAVLDAMIAAHAKHLEVTLVSNDQAFEQVSGLALEDWRS